MLFQNLKINYWRQYNSINLNFHPRLTIITGANGAGKTTLLNILNNHFGWPGQLVGTPKKDSKTGKIKFISDFWKQLFSDSKNVSRNHSKIGEIIYTSNDYTNLSVPETVGSTYAVKIEKRLNVRGFHIPSHRPIYKYQNINNLSTSAISRQNAFQQYRQSKHQRYRGASVNKSETHHIKEALISLAMFGYGNEVVTRNYEAIELFEGFQNILRRVLPKQLGFQRISIRVPEVILETKSGEFALDAVSGGIAAVIDLAWQIFMFVDDNEPFCVTFDEPENHLHPEMQKTILPNFLDAFRHAQFVVATHNPFVISSVADSNVYVLNYDENNKVNSMLLDNIDKSGSANDILRNVLGIESTSPDWVDNQLDIIIEKYSDSGITPENIDRFKSEIRRIGLDKYVHTSVADLLNKSKSKR